MINQLIKMGLGAFLLLVSVLKAEQWEKLPEISGGAGQFETEDGSFFYFLVGGDLYRGGFDPDTAVLISTDSLREKVRYAHAYPNRLVASIYPGEGLYYSDDQGETWNPSGTSYDYTVSCPILEFQDMLLLCDSGWGMHVSRDSGKTWVREDQDAHMGNSEVLEPVNSLIFRGYRGVSVSDDTSQTWTLISTGLPYRTVGVEGYTDVNGLVYYQNKLFAGTGDGLYVSDNLGASWSPANLGGEFLGIDLLEAVQGRLYAYMDEKLYFSQDEGVSWDTLNLPETIKKAGSWSSPYYIEKISEHQGRLILSTNEAGMYYSGDQGASWKAFTSGYQNQVYRGIYMQGGQKIMITANSLYRFDSLSAVWNEMSGGLEERISSSFSPSLKLTEVNSDLYVLAAGRFLYRYDAQNETWVQVGLPPQPSGIEAYLQLFYLHSFGQKLWLVASYENFSGPGTVILYHTEDKGQNWTQPGEALSLDSTESSVSAAYLDESQFMLWTNTNSIYVSQDKGGTWERKETGIPFNSNSQDEGGENLVQLWKKGSQWAASFHKGFYTSTSSLDAWEPQNFGLWAADPGPGTNHHQFVEYNNHFLMIHNREILIPNSQTGWWEPFEVPFPAYDVSCLAIEGNVLYAAREKEGIYRIDLSLVPSLNSSNSVLYPSGRSLPGIDKKNLYNAKGAKKRPKDIENLKGMHRIFFH